MPRDPSHHVFATVAIVDDGRVLLVQEEKPDVHGLWSLPGGRLEPGESVVDGALREVAEETGLRVTPTGVVGVYTGPRWVWFVLRGDRVDDAVPLAGDEILDVAWRSPEAIDRLRDDEIASPPVIRSVVDRIRRGVEFPLDVLASS